jgi:hypothetical protein
MTQADHNLRPPSHFSPRLLAAAAVLFAFGLGLSARASAAYEQVGIFSGSLTPPVEKGVFPEEVQLAGVGGMAVNITGAGGVPPGTVYAATRASLDEVRIARFNADGSFSEAWLVKSQAVPLELCGPDAPSPPAPEPETPCPPRPTGQSGGFWDVDVNQATGNVYVFIAGAGLEAGADTIIEYNADGTEVISRFGKLAPGGATTASTPDQVHSSDAPGGLAVNSAGEVYVFDLNGQDNFYHRLMVFKPKTPGDYTEYEYAGQSKDIGAGFLNQSEYPLRPAVDSAGDVYVAGEDYVQKYDPAQPSKPICEREVKSGGITAITVNPENGEVFYFSYKKVGGKKKLHQLSPCSEGTFAEPDPFGVEVSPERDDIYGLAFNPIRKFDPSRAPGVLYGAAPSPIPGTGGTGQPGASALGYIFAQVQEDPPIVESESVSHVTSTTAELGTEINPRGSETSYAFQYISDAAYEEAGESFTGVAEAPPGGALLGGGQIPLSAAVALSGLAPDTEYHFRAVASSHCSPKKEPAKVCEGAGEAEVFRTFPVQAPGLPDNRAWELVSPVQKHGGQVIPADPEVNSCGNFFGCKPGGAYRHFPMQSSPDGEAIVYEGSSFSPGEGAFIENEYLARRSASGWQSTNLTPSQLESKGGLGYRFFNEGLTEGLLEQVSPALSPAVPPDYANLYLQPTGDPLALSPLLTDTPLNYTAPFNRVSGAVGPDRLKLTYAGASADLSRVFFEANDALTEASPFAPEAIDGGAAKSNLYEWAGGRLRLVNVAPENTEAAPGAAFGSGTLLKSGYQNIPVSVVPHAISEDGSRIFWSSEVGQLYLREDGETTKAIPDPGLFLSASPDGSRVLLSNGHVYDLETEATTDLSEGKGGFQGLLGQSEDLSRLYFIDTAVLDETPNQEGAVAKAGQNNLYAWEQGSSAYVATMSPQDQPGSGGGGFLSSGDWTPAPSLRTAEASPNGRWVTFLSQAPLTGYDNTGPCNEDSGTGEFLITPCSEAFLYDSATGKLTCASCNPANTRPLGPSTLRLILGAKGSLPQPRYLTDEGRLYFDTQDSLSLSDTNEGVEDVYQYEPEEVGGCKREAGCVSLISAGREAIDSNFLAMDETGKNVFFTTHDQLALKDKDDLYDLYVAREGGGIPAETEVARSECQGEACVAALSPPNDPTPGSSSFEGAGNVDEKKAAKKHKHKKKRKQAKKHAHKRAAKHNRGGAK